MKRAWLMVALGFSIVGAAGVALTQGAEPSTSGPSTQLQVVGPEVLVKVPWGVGPDNLGRLDGNEGASEGPMSFQVASDGTIWFLDQTRFRLAQFNDQGAFLREVPIPGDTFQEFEVMADGSFVVLDRLARRVLLVLDQAGKVVSDVAVEGKGIAEGGSVTAMLTDDKGVWLENEHSTRVKVLDESLQPCTREVVRGRRLRPGVDLLAARDRAGGARIWTEHRGDGTVSASEKVGFGHDIARIVWLETDAGGDVHAVFHLLEYDSADPKQVSYEEVVGVRYDEKLRVRDTWSSRWVIRLWEQFREVRIAPDGTVYQMGFEDTGVTIARWRWTS